MKLDLPAIDLLDDEITAIADEFLDDENEGSDEEEFAPWVDMEVDSSDDETDSLPEEEDPNWPQTTASSAEVEKSSELVLEDWDPCAFEKEEASPQCLLRIQDDMLDLEMNPLPGVCIQPMDISRFHVLMVGPSGTLCEGDDFYFLLQCPRDYPMRPPRVRLMNAGRWKLQSEPARKRQGVPRHSGHHGHVDVEPRAQHLQRARRDPVAADAAAVISLPLAGRKSHGGHFYSERCMC
ncbi:hypothetical protein MTO96_011162 [Rhipicephalus appendiculatus]